MELSLENFIPAYPSQDDELIQWKTTLLREFNILETKSDEAIPEPGEYFNHQKLFSRLLRTYDKCLLVHETGTGKTCTMTSLSEFYREFEPGRINSVYVLEKGDTTKKDFKNQIMTRCTKGSYARSKDISKFYKIMTYGHFVKNEIGDLSDDQIVEKFSGCIFFIDEAHNIRNFDKQKAPDGILIEYDNHNYDKIKKVLRLAQRSKVVISTATPMINEPGELGKLIELVNDEDLPDFDWAHGSFADIEPYFRGRVSFLRALDTGIEVIYHGDKQRQCPGVPASETEQMNVMHVAMVPNGFQDLAHRAVENDRSAVWRNPIQTSSFVSPISSNLSKNAISGPDNLTLVGANDIYKWNNAAYKNLRDREDPTGERLNLTEYFADYNRLKECSVKFAFIVEQEVNYRYHHPNGIVKKDLRNQWLEQNVPISEQVPDKGNAFVYTELVEKSGAIYLGLILESYGFSRFTYRNDGIDSNGKITIPKGLRYGMMIHKSTEETVLLNRIFNHPDNANGDYVQIIIGSEIARDGINLYNVVRGYLLTPDWHIAGMYQAMSRFIRSTSHINLVEQRRNEIANGADLDPRVKVDVYRLAAVNSAGHSTDDCIYQRAGEKDYLNRRVLRFLKQVSIDCMIHYNRNVRPEDEDYSQQCDYDKCRYPCWTSKPPRNNFEPNSPRLAQGQGPYLYDYDYRNYNLLYERDRRQQIKKAIISFLNINGSVSFDDVINSIQKSSNESREIVEYYVYDTVETMINEKVLFQGVFGDENYLQTDGNNIYSEKEYLNTSQSRNYRETGYYSQLLVGIEEKTINELIKTDVNIETIDSKLAKLKLNNKFIFAFIDLIKDQQNRIKYFEDLLIRAATSESLEPYETYILEYYRYLWYQLPRQDHSVESVRNYLITPKRGAPAKSLRKITVPEDRFKYEEDENNPNRVVCHIYYESPANDYTSTGTKYTRNIYFRPTHMKVRIMDLSQTPPAFRDLTDVEYHIYPPLIYQQFKEATDRQRRNGTYAIVYDGEYGSISFVNDSEEDGAQRKQGDGRQKSRGVMCSSINADLAFEYLNGLTGNQIQYDVSDIPEKDFPDDETMIEDIRKAHRGEVELTDKRAWLKKAWAITTKNKKKSVKKETICEILYNSYIAAELAIIFPAM